MTKAARKAERRVAVEARLEDSRLWAEGVLERLLPAASGPFSTLHEAMRYAAEPATLAQRARAETRPAPVHA